ncbi:MAG: hypothetical protein ACYC4R_13435 [Anaerolineae bacterium]
MSNKKPSEKQIAANRSNALKGTGPRTIEGKARSRWNALTHGALAKAVIPPALEPYESREAFDVLLATLHEEFAPASAMEEMLVERIATSYWRLARVLSGEARAIAQRQDEALNTNVIPSMAEILRLKRPPSTPQDPPAAQSDPQDDYVSVPYLDRALQFARYEAAIERQIYRALDALERLQRLRRGDTVPPPLLVHVDTTAEDRPLDT